MPATVREGKLIGLIILLAEIDGPVSPRLNWWYMLK